MKKSPPICHRALIPRGFTLVELLVVIAIISVLVLMSFMLMSKMRNIADKATSTSNISRLQVANASYATDHNGSYCPTYTFDGDGVNTGAWWKNPDFLAYLTGDDPVANATGSAPKVPSGLLDPVAYRSRKKNHDSLIASYGYCDTGFASGGFGSANASHAFRMAQVVSPERSAAFFTATDWLVQYGGAKRVWSDEDYEPVEGYSGGQGFAARYRGKVLVAYYDGHVGEMSFADFRKIDSEGGRNHIFWNADGK